MPKKLSPKVARALVKAGNRQALAVEYYTQGWSLRQIAAELGYAGPSGAQKAIKTAIKNIPSRAVEERRTEVDERYRLALSEFMPIVMNKRTALDKRLAAWDRVEKINKGMRELHGLDAPAQTIALTAEMPSKDVRQELLDRLARLAEAAVESADPQPPHG